MNTDREIVRKKFPRSEAMFCDWCNAWHIYGSGFPEKYLALSGDTPEQAWADAANRIKEKVDE